MATTPVTPAPPTQSTIDTELQNSLASLAHKHVTISYTLVGIILVILAVCCVGAYFGEKSYEKAMDRAEAAEKSMDADRAQYATILAGYQKQLDTNNAQIQAAQIQEASLIAQIKNRDTTANTGIATVLAPGKSAMDAYADLAAAYKDVNGPDGHPPVLSLNVSKDPTSGEQLLTFSVPAAQTFTATALADKRDAADLSSTQDELEQEQTKSAAFNSNWQGAQASLVALQKTDDQCQLTVAAYKTVAKKSRFKKIMSGALKGALFAAGIYIGHKI